MPGKCNKTRERQGKAGDSYMLPWAFQYLATTLKSFLPTPFLTHLGRQWGEDHLLSAKAQIIYYSYLLSAF